MPTRNRHTFALASAGLFALACVDSGDDPMSDEAGDMTGTGQDEDTGDPSTDSTSSSGDSDTDSSDGTDTSSTDTSDTEGSGADSSGTESTDTADTADTDPLCVYPEGAAEPMALDEVLSPYSWPEANRSDGATAALDLANVPCATDEVIDWSDHDLLVFVSLPAWCPGCVEHTASVVQVEQQIVDAGAEIIWVLEADGFGTPGTVETCRNFMDSLGSELGWCVGDGQTVPDPGVFDSSPFGMGRGFDIVVPRATMEVAYATNHGLGDEFDNITGEELLAQIQMIADSL